MASCLTPSLKQQKQFSQLWLTGRITGRDHCHFQIVPSLLLRLWHSPGMAFPRCHCFTCMACLPRCLRHFTAADALFLHRGFQPAISWNGRCLQAHLVHSRAINSPDPAWASRDGKHTRRQFRFIRSCSSFLAPETLSRFMVPARIHSCPNCRSDPVAR